jgi:hypothetical protein
MNRFDILLKRKPPPKKEIETPHSNLQPGGCLSGNIQGITGMGGIYHHVDQGISEVFGGTETFPSPASPVYEPPHENIFRRIWNNKENWLGGVSIGFLIALFIFFITFLIIDEDREEKSAYKQLKKISVVLPIESQNINKDRIDIKQLMTTLIRFGEEKGYFEGQLDAKRTKFNIKRIDSTWNWDHNPWDASFNGKLLFHPDKGAVQSYNDMIGGFTK